LKLYAISGLGADKRVFEYLKLDCKLVPIEWIQLTLKETIEDYAIRLSQVIDQNEEFGIMGVSFGGLVAVEMSKKLNPTLTILISSAETKNELRTIFRWFGKTQLLRILPAQWFDPPRWIAYLLFGTKKEKLLNSILDDTDPYFAKWAVNALLNWRNKERLKNPLKISGTKDKLIPPSTDYSIKLIGDGGHFMIVDRAEEISRLINKRLKRLSDSRNE